MAVWDASFSQDDMARQSYWLLTKHAEQGERSRRHCKRGGLEPPISQPPPLLLHYNATILRSHATKFINALHNVPLKICFEEMGDAPQ